MYTSIGCWNFQFQAHLFINTLAQNVSYQWLRIGMLYMGGSSGGWLSSKESACSAGDTGDLGLIPGLGRSLGEGLAAHPYIPAWRIPWTEEDGRLQSIGLQRAGHNWSNLACKHAPCALCFIIWTYLNIYLYIISYAVASFLMATCCRLTGSLWNDV